MNLMVSVCVSLVVPGMTCIASICALPSVSRFVDDIVVRPSPQSMTLRTTLHTQ